MDHSIMEKFRRKLIITFTKISTLFILPGFLIVLTASCEPDRVNDEQVTTVFHEESSGGPDDIAQSPNYTTILTKSVPSGNYVVKAKVVVSDTENADPFPATARCTIFSGSDVLDTFALQMGPPRSGFNTKVFTLQGIASATGDSADLSLRCRKGSNDTTQVSIRENPRLTAIRIGEIL